MAFLKVGKFGAKGFGKGKGKGKGKLAVIKPKGKGKIGAKGAKGFGGKGKGKGAKGFGGKGKEKAYCQDYGSPDYPMGTCTSDHLPVRGEFSQELVVLGWGKIKQTVSVYSWNLLNIGKNLGKKVFQANNALNIIENEHQYRLRKRAQFRHLSRDIQDPGPDVLFFQEVDFWHDGVLKQEFLGILNPDPVRPRYRYYHATSQAVWWSPKHTRESLTCFRIKAFPARAELVDYAVGPGCVLFKAEKEYEGCKGMTWPLALVNCHGVPGVNYDRVFAGLDKVKTIEPEKRMKVMGGDMNNAPAPSWNEKMWTSRDTHIKTNTFANFDGFWVKPAKDAKLSDTTKVWADAKYTRDPVTKRVCAEKTGKN